ncbi:hypothetical protein ESCO_005678 [Escovopsis weberi]|uniref:Gylcosyl hydrolase 115 C-terminal domain-containing protein n=1 Tax=Escovopsis weberi TaxID=150374 RepID=A0A0M9VUF2_ESCWE|nr:hypothetical protein ESCO_005678 [Escovopsis weberi]
MNIAIAHEQTSRGFNMIQTIISTKSGDGFSLVGADILIDAADWAGVRIAANNLAKDFARVTDNTSRVESNAEQHSASSHHGRSCIIVGSLTHSPMINKLWEQGKIDASRIKGKWESWLTTCVKDPVAGYDNGLVIAGSDKRGTIFGIYTLAEQIGISPWHWWADVPPKKKKHIVALPVTTHNGEPSVKYRGIFINDECPGMDSWAQEKFGPKFGSELYHHIFELLLRLKANFLWPAMWRGYPYPGRSFFVDDPKNQELADQYGIVVGTSHHEPMQRAMNEWSTTQPPGTWNWDTNREKVTEYFEEGAKRAVPYESYFTLGMRGEGDSPMQGRDPMNILKEVLATQRSIIKKNYGREDGVLQLMALYKEVQGYYNRGLEIPDDYYYHFQYTGYPRCYRWINSNTLGKALHQLQLAYEGGSNRIWIFNVGDLKPIEIPMSFAFDYAWDVTSITATTLPQYFERLAAREFGGEHAAQIARCWYDFNKLIALRKQDHIDADTFIIQKYHEADNVNARWKKLLAEAQKIDGSIDKAHKSAFFQLVLHPVKASSIFVDLRVTQYKNQLFAKQRRNTTNAMLRQSINLLDSDHELFEEYNRISGGKWNLIMRQPHYGYGPGGGQPSRNMIDGLCYVQTREDSNPSVGHMGIAVEGIEGINPGHINEDSDRTHPSRKWLEAGVTLPFITPYGEQTRYFEVFNRGTREFLWEARPQHPWIKLSQYKGVSNPRNDDVRVVVTIDWKSVPAGFDDKVWIEIVGNRDGFELIHLTVRHERVPPSFEGFVEESGHLAIDAASAVSAPYVHLPALGRPLAGSVTLGPGADLSRPGGIPFLRYPIWVFSERDNVALELQFGMTIDTDRVNKMRFDVRLDGAGEATYRLTEDNPRDDQDLPQGWNVAVMDGVWKKRHNLGRVRRGAHLLEVRMRSANMCLEKMILDLGDLRYTYLGPPQSEYVKMTSQISDVQEEDVLDIEIGYEER